MPVSFTDISAVLICAVKMATTGGPGFI